MSKPKMAPEREGISMQEFIRTRDSVVTGLTKLNGAISTLIDAFVSHTNELLSSEEGATLDTVALSEYLARAGLSREPLEDIKKEKKKRVKKEKDPNAPKRPLTAFFLFSTRAREHIKEELGAGATPVAVNSEILRRWKVMDEPQKLKWKGKYAENFADYQREVAEYKAKTGKEIAVEEAASDDELPEIDAIDPALTMPEAEDTSDEDSSEDEEEEPPKPPTPPPKKAKAASKRKPKENGAAALPAPSPSPSAQLTKTPIPLPGEKVPSAKKRKDVSPEEPKKKKARKSKNAEEEVVPVAAPVPEKKKKAVKGRKNQGF